MTDRSGQSPREKKSEATDYAGKPWSALQFGQQYHRSTSSVIVRGLDGSIYYWNRAAERHYGWRRRQAVGNVSHTLLETVFPCPLHQINQELLEKGVWEGELIHTLSDGTRVKVLSRWELQPSETPQATAVVEINSALEKLRPDTAFLNIPLTRRERVLKILGANKRYWLTPIIVMLLSVAILGQLFNGEILIPLFE